MPAKLPRSTELGWGNSGFTPPAAGLLPSPHVQFWQPKTAGDWVVHIAGGIVAIFREVTAATHSLRFEVERQIRNLPGLLPVCRQHAQNWDSHR
jgi:hypothetical protein